MDRLEAVQKLVDVILMAQPDLEIRHNGFVHLYGVSSFCSLLAMKRGLNVELCSIAGMLHDIVTYKTGNSLDHAKLGAIEAEKILSDMKLFYHTEIEQLCKAISNHSKKQNIDEAFDEVLKDADVLHHYLYNTNLPINKNESTRLRALSLENGFVMEG